MAMVTITGLVKDETGRMDSRDWEVYSASYREGTDGALITPRTQPVRVVAGAFEVELEPGPAVLINPDGKRYTVTIPAEDADLWDVIEAAVAFPPDTAQELLAAAVDAYLASNDVYRLPEGGIPMADLAAEVQLAISSGGGEGAAVDIQAGTDISVNKTNPLAPVISLGSTVRTAIAAAQSTADSAGTAASTAQTTATAAGTAASAAQSTADGKYTKPGTGIPKSDLSSAVQDALDAAGGGGYVKPEGGIPKSDLASTVQDSLNGADTAVQSVETGSIVYGTDGSGTPTPQGYSSTAATANTIAKRNASGQIVVTAGTASGHAVTKSQLEDAIAALPASGGENHYLIYTDTEWPARPDDDLPVIWVGGDAPDDAPSEQQAGDIWLPASGDGTPLGATLEALQAMTIADDLDSDADDEIPTVAAVRAYIDTVTANTRPDDETTYTLAATDIAGPVEVTTDDDSAIVIPTNASVAIPVGHCFEVINLGTGDVTLSPDSGVTVMSEDGNTKLSGVCAAVVLRKRTTDGWVAVGKLSS